MFFSFHTQLAAVTQLQFNYFVKRKITADLILGQVRSH